MELAEGRTLRDALGGGALSPRRALIVARQILLGLQLAHPERHRAPRPQARERHAAAGRRGRRQVRVVKLLDFGLVKLLGIAPRCSAPTG